MVYFPCVPAFKFPSSCQGLYEGCRCCVQAAMGPRPHRRLSEDDDEDPDEEDEQEEEDDADGYADGEGEPCPNCGRVYRSGILQTVLLDVPTI